MDDRGGKRRRLDGESGHQAAKLAAKFKPTIPRQWTVSVAVPTSIISDCTSREQMSVNAGRIARALAIFSIDEVVIFDDSPTDSRPPDADLDAFTGETDPAHFLEHILSYLETPPFMRKSLWPLHPNLRSQGLLPNLDMPHHPHKDEWLPYREGITVESKTKHGKGTQVDIGMNELVTISESIPPKTRLTLQLSEDGGNPQPVHPTAPRTDAGYPWGFTVRKCGSLSSVFTTSPYDDGYDVSIGTSERGVPISSAFPSFDTLDFSHLLVVFGGPRGLEYAAMNDGDLAEMNISQSRTKELFDHWVDALPYQGTRSIRTDEAMLIALTGLRRLWDSS
ncbi:DUF171-domain-containing protein [Thozetella sp. PMI_491]|nr:DUF171-domain-containing protein [Thozetella sp. PMI_491]